MNRAGRRIILVALHAATAGTIVFWIGVRYDLRSQELAELHRIEAEQRAELSAKQEHLAVVKARRDGLLADDPYVWELIAREKHQFRSPGESKPPPLVRDSNVE